MKKITLTTIIAICFNFFGFSQPVLNSTDFVEGVSAYGYYLDVPTFNPGSSGENQTWDFSTLPSNGYDFQYTTVPFATSPSSSNYIEGNFCFKEQYLSVTNYAYYKLSTTVIELIGNVENGVPGDYFPNFRTYFTFPFTYGLVINDSYQKSISSSTQYEQITYDAYGTLVLPTGTYTNVIRRKIITTDSTTPRYMWLQVNPFRILLVGEVGSTNNVLVYQTAILNTQNNSDKAFTIYPNPVESELEIENTNSINASIIVYDILGNIILKKEINDNLTNIDFSLLSSGLYLIKIFSKDNNLLFLEKIIRK